MRGCLTFIVGLLIGAGVMAFWWPKVPAGQSVPQQADIHIRISDSYLSHLVQPQASGLGFTDVVVTSVPPSELVARGNLTVGPVTLPAALSFQPVAVNGALHVNLVEAQVAGIPLPGQLVPVVAGRINSAINQRVGKQAAVQSVRVTPSGLDVTANYR